MANTLGAVLIAEVGSLITRVTLVDQVDGESRLIGRAEILSSTELPLAHALFGIIEATAQISRLTSRQLLRDGQFIMPQNRERDGVNQILITTSAAGPLQLVITAITSDISAQSAVQASRATYTQLLQLLTLAASTGHDYAEQRPIREQVEQLLRLNPDVIVIAGGIEDGGTEAIQRLAHIVSLTAITTTVDGEGQQQRGQTLRPVIYAGSHAAREQVSTTLGDCSTLTLVDNLRPDVTRTNLNPTRQELERLYEQRILPRLGGSAALRQLSQSPIRAVCAVEGLMTRFLAERTQRRVLAIDVGAASSAAFYATPGRYHPAVLGTTGVAQGLTGLLTDPGITAISRWLPFPIEASALIERLLNRALRPQQLPASREDLWIEHALAREAIRAAYHALRDEVDPTDADWLIATGGVLTHAPTPGLALLTLLDAIQPTGASDHPIMDVYLDNLGLFVASGTLAGLDPEAAISLIDRDLLQNMPLASLVTLLGEGTVGDIAATVEFSTIDGESRRIPVAHGDLIRLALPRGRYAQLRISPAKHVRVGLNAPGVVVTSPGGDLPGSILGLVIDARGRPLTLPDDPAQRHARLWSWLVALNAEQGENPALVQPQKALAGATELTAPAVAGKRIALDALPPEETGANAEPLERDLDALRQTVAPPKKRGWFGHTPEG
jgi:hypothetical protein